MNLSTVTPDSRFLPALSASHLRAAAVGICLFSFGFDSYGGEDDHGPFDPGTREYTNSIGVQFVRISGGSFLMGDEGGEDDERPVHEVVISRDFYIGRYEVTQAQWQEVMESNPSHFADCADCPVENVSWDDVQLFMDRLNQQEGEQLHRLPTEAEWEYAARAGSTTRWSFGNAQGQLPEFAWYMDNSEDQTHPVGQKEPNAWGLYDVHGNVYEWVHDWYSPDYYGNSPNVDPLGPASGTARVVRGGTWYTHFWWTRTGFRSMDLPDSRISGTGFRLLREIQQDVSSAASPPIRPGVTVQHYPDPSAGIVNFTYTLSNASSVQLRVFDLVGREMALVVDRFLSAGRHEVAFDTSSLPVGLYIYRLEAGTHRASGTVTLVR